MWIDVGSCCRYHKCAGTLQHSLATLQSYKGSMLQVSDCAQMHLYKCIGGVLCSQVTSAPMACEAAVPM